MDPIAKQAQDDLAVLRRAPAMLRRHEHDIMETQGAAARLYAHFTAVKHRSACGRIEESMAQVECVAGLREIEEALALLDGL